MNHSKYILKLTQIWKLSFPKELNSLEIISESCRVSVNDALPSSQQEMTVASLLIQRKKKIGSENIIFQNYNNFMT